MPSASMSSKMVTKIKATAARRTGEQLHVPVEQLARLMVMALEGLVLLYLAGGAADRCRGDLDVLADALGALALGA